tara:strand:+ start:1264 stop:2964 length:1701 start_codon:yes stop_codon:yes gene_type:complete
LVNEIISFPRHLSQHVGGFVISSGPLYELVPVENAAMHDRTIIQWDKDDLETLGLLKVDVLALGMLSAIRKCFDLIKRIHGRSLTIAEITRLKDDPQVYGMIQRADTVGIFQIESRAQMSMLPRLKPRTYYDLVIQIAIVRPGPIQGDMVHPYLKRRDGIEPISYPSKEVESVLSRTMGVPIFQEQVIKLAMVAAGFTGGEADKLRRAMAAWKKNGNVFKFKNKLIEGMQKRGYDIEFAEQIFKQICGFGEYGFPESHSASFAILAYCSAWLKCYYPECFYASLLNSQPMGFYSPSQLVQDAQRHNVAILPVCVNSSQDNHTVVSQQNGLAIRSGMRQIKGLSEHGIQSVLANRPHSGYRHPSQVKQLSINKKDIELLASANALHNVSGDRFQTRWSIMDSASDLPLFSQIDDSFGKGHDEQGLQQPSEMQDLLEDFTSVGISLNKYPITLLEEANRLGRFTHMKDLKQQRHKSMVNDVGLVTGKQSPGTAAGVTFVTLEDNTGNINVVIWGSTARAQQQAYLTAKALKVQGILEKEGEVVHMIAGKLINITDEIVGLKTKSRDFH